MNNKSKDTQTTEAIIRPFTLQQYRKTYPIHQNRFSEIEVSIASPEDIGLWSSGEITRSETVNYKTGKPEKNGLFCQTIFGPVRSYSCSCGKFEKAQGSSSTKCDVCGVELTDKIIRRVRMGHIDLLTPVAHIWFFKIAGAKAIPTLLENTLIDVSKDGSGDFKPCSLKTNAIEQIIYYQSYILTDLGNLPPKLLKPFSIFQIYSQEIEQQMQLVLKKLKQWFEDPSKNVGDEKKRNRGINLLIEALSVFEDDNIPFNLGSNLDVIEEITKCKFEIGAIAIQEILKRIDLGHNIKEFKRKLARVKRNGKIPKELLNKINIFENFKKNSVKPEWMILTKIPVIPADLRPMVALEGGRYSTTSLNELYRKIIIRNDKIKRLKDNGAPKALIISSYRLLQEAVDTLIDNKKRTTPEQMKNAPKGNPAKSLADSLLGKKGRFRQNLLGKRVDFSGRSVITVGPQLKLYQCGLPKELALELYKPFIMTKLIEAGKRMTEDGTERKTIDYKGAERMIKMKDTQIWKYVHAALEERPVLLNRAPTLHRLGIQAFEPVLVDGRAIQLHPLATTAFNADFDGDQMAVHLPISKEAINEARSRMLGSTNILGPKDGEPIISPTQDMTLGLYYLTTERSKAHFKSLGVNVEEKEVLGEGKIFATQKDALVCHENDVIGLHALIGIRISGLRKKYLFTEEDQNKFLLTTVGKIIFNDILSDGLSFINDSTQNARFRSTHDIYDNVKELRDHLESHTTLKKPLTKKCVSTIIRDAFDIVQETIDAESRSFSERDERIKEHKLNSIMSKMLDHLKRLGFKYSTTSGISIAYSDVFVPEEKTKFIERANKLALQIDEYKALGQFSKTEYTKRIVNLWNKTKENLQRELVRKLEKQTRNPIFLMATSGARGNQSNFTQLMGMRGIMTNPQGEAIAIPVKSSFREGLTINEFFISTHGARKGNVDTAMKTGHSGYLTRIFIDSCQNVTVDSLDCGTKSTYTVKAITEKESPDSDKEVIIVPLKDRIFGRVAGKEIKKNGKVIVKKDELITRTIADAIISADIEEVEIWSILKGTGVSQKCYGLDLSTKKLIRPNTAVGVIAAQAIGEPGTQLTMNTFHTGGVADDADITQGLPIIEGIVKFQRVGARPVDKNEDVITKVPGTVQEIFDNINDSAWSNIVVSRKVPGKNERPITYKVRKKSKILVKEGQELKAGQRLTEGYLQLYKIWKYAGIDAVYDAMMRAYHKVYRQQSISISDKYFEIVIKQMTNKLRIISPGQTKFLPGQFVEVRDFTNENARVIEKGRAPAFGRLWILTAIRSSLLSKSFLWSISFQETTQYLAKAVITGKKDPLQGLKENVIFGNLIPVGTGMIKNKEDFFFDNDAKNVNKY